VIVTCEQSSGNLCRRRALLAGQLASQSGLLQFAVTFLKDHVFESLKLVGRGDVPDRGMEPDAVVAVDVRGDSTAGTTKVSGLNGTAAWGARIYGDGRRTGDRPDRFGRVVLADSTGEQHASRMKGVGRFP
jgi:hypothetical protein